MRQHECISDVIGLCDFTLIPQQGGPASTITIKKIIFASVMRIKKGIYNQHLTVNMI